MKIRIFNHYVDAPMWLLAIIEGSILISAVYLAVQLRFISGSYADLVEFGPVFMRAFVLAVVMLSIMVALGLYNTGSKWGEWRHYSVYLASYGIGFIALTVIYYVFPGLFLGRGVLALSLFFGFIGITSVRLLFFGLMDGEAKVRRVLVLGSGSRPANIATLLSTNDSSNRFSLAGFVSEDSNEHDEKISSQSLIVSENRPLLALARQNNVNEIVVGVRQRRGGTLKMDELLECRLEGINVIDLPTFFERETGKVLLDSLNPSWVIFSEGFNRGTLTNAVKSAIDVSVSIILFVLVAPIMALTAAAIKLESKGPVLYRQQRVGECGQTFNVLKFRSMTVDAEKEGCPQWAQENDNRITHVGKIIRKLRIDELPQIFNVLNGDMSFIGPRPERPFFVNQLAEKIPYYSARHSVKPGITGWAQVRYPYGSSVEDAKEKLQYDLYYAKNHSWFLDLIILFETVQVILFGRGAR